MQITALRLFPVMKFNENTVSGGLAFSDTQRGGKKRRLFWRGVKLM